MILQAARTAWAPLFCAGCEKLFHYQLEDVLKVAISVQSPGQVMSQSRGSPVTIFVVTCKCGVQTEVGRRNGE